VGRRGFAVVGAFALAMLATSVKVFTRTAVQ
jgi:hypothetical protein